MSDNYDTYEDYEDDEEFIPNEYNDAPAAVAPAPPAVAPAPPAVESPEAAHARFIMAEDRAGIIFDDPMYFYLSELDKKRQIDYYIAMKSGLDTVAVNKTVMAPFGFFDLKNNREPATIKKTSACRWEITEKRVMLFNNYMEAMLEADTSDFKDFFQFVFSNGNIENLSDTNKYKPYDKVIEFLSAIKYAEDVTRRRDLLIQLLKLTPEECPLELKKLFGLAFDVIKKSQVIEVEFNNYPGTTAYYIAHDCLKDKLVYLASSVSVEYPGQTNEDKGDGLIPNKHKPVGKEQNEIKSTLPTKFTLDEITEINSWLSYGSLSIYLINPEFIKKICINPLIGDESFWNKTKKMLDKQFQILYNLSKPAVADLEVFRGSRHFSNKPYRVRSIFSTSTNSMVANLFAGGDKDGKKIIIPAGTRILDLTMINKKEKEILIFPANLDTNMIIEKVANANPEDPANRNTYRIRNANVNRNRNIVRSRKGRRSNRRRQTRRR
jgi:hypothetical protein